MLYSSSVMKKTTIFVTIVLTIMTSYKTEALDKMWSDEEETNEFWLSKAQDELEAALDRQNLNKRVAKNVILMMGDGMGIPTITAGRILKGQLRGQSGEEFVMAMDKFPHVALSKTYSIDSQVTDSAASATAYLCGVKTNTGTIGVDGRVERRNCTSSKGAEVYSILKDSFDAGKSTGFVTTTRINHASPAGTYAHVANRGWYGDTDLSDDAKENGCKDIAQQFYDNSHMITVALGGGRRYFRPIAKKDEEYPRLPYNRRDGQDLIQKWLDDGENATREFVWNKLQFDNVNPITTDKLLGIFEPGDMKYEINRQRNAATPEADEPSIADMTEKAIRMLQKNPKGFFLFVEGGRIDQGHHATTAIHALNDVVAFDEAIQRAVELTSELDTLIVVTADHSHTMSLGGYAFRGNPIFGLAPSNDDPDMATDGKPYTSLLYANGAGYQGLAIDGGRENLTEINTGGQLYLQQTAVPRTPETHGGEDVAILARGPMAHLFHSVHEQPYIAYAMRYASCVGENKDHCSEQPKAAETTAETEPPIAASFLGMELDAFDTVAALYVQFVLVICLAFFTLLFGVLLFRSKDLSQIGASSYEGIKTSSTAL